MKTKKNSIVCAVCLAVCVVCLALAGCHNKKKIAPKQEVAVAQEEVNTPSTPNTPSETSEPAIEPIVELVEEAIEEKADEEHTPSPQSGTPPALGGELWTPQYQTAYGKGMVTIFYKQQRLSSPVVMTYIADSIIVASVQPLMGIEMYRLEALPDKARLFEKLNRRYVEMTYEEISAETKRNIDFPLVERMVEEVGLTFPIGQDTTLRYSGVEANLSLQYRTVNQPVSAFPISANGYSRSTIKAIFSK